MLVGDLGDSVRLLDIWSPYFSSSARNCSSTKSCVSKVNPERSVMLRSDKLRADQCRASWRGVATLKRRAVALTWLAYEGSHDPQVNGSFAVVHESRGGG
jgi:hypothetical protein